MKNKDKTFNIFQRAKLKVDKKASRIKKVLTVVKLKKEELLKKDELSYVDTDYQNNIHLTLKLIMGMISVNRLHH